MTDAAVIKDRILRHRDFTLLIVAKLLGWIA